jgi:DNA-directed RNA polymerase
MKFIGVVARTALLCCSVLAISVQAVEFKLPAYEKVTLDNGLTLYLLPQHEVPLVTVQAVVKAGAIYDDKAGLSSLTAQALMLGAGGKTKSEIEQTIDFLGASLNSASSLEGSMVQANFMAKDSATLLPLVKALLMQPAFEEAEFKKMQQREIAALTQAKESPRQVIDQYFHRLVFGQHPYGYSQQGEPESVQQITRSDLTAFHQKYYQPNNTAIVVAGDFDPRAIKLQLQQLFGDWKNTVTLPKRDLAKALTTPTQSQVLLVDKSDAIETTFIMGGPGVTQSNPDYVGITVINTVLGGRFTSWLNDELRVNSGLTYGASSGFDRYSAAGLFSISSFTKTDSTKAALDLALKTYQKLWTQGLDQATLDSAKAYVKGQFPPRFETNRALAQLLGDMYLYGFTEEYINSFQSKVDNLTVAESKRLINSYFPKDKLQFVLIGKAEAIAPLAASYGKVTQLDIKAPGYGN